MDSGSEGEPGGKRPVKQLLVGGQRKTDAVHESDFVYPEADRRGDLDHQLYAGL